uniref:Uncharacterized protein n=1 Tax=Arundo donax TaxID=35708 RepID=A0A0A9CCS6_ARUDO
MIMVSCIQVTRRYNCYIQCSIEPEP